MDMKKLLEKMDQFAGQAVGQKPGDQVRGTDKATPKKSGKHPFDGRLVGASESKNLLADLEKELVEGAVKRGLKEEFEAFKEQGVAEGLSKQFEIVYLDQSGNRRRKIVSGTSKEAVARQFKKQYKLEIEQVKQLEQGVAEGAPELLKKEMPTHRHAEKLLAQNGVSKDDPDYHHHLNNTIKYLRQFGNIDLINKSDEQGVAEGSGEIKIPTEDGITMQDIRLMAGEGPLTKKTILQAIAVIRKQRRPQGVAEGSLEEVDRRGFLKGMGAAAVAGTGLAASGNAKADVEGTMMKLYGISVLYMACKEPYPRALAQGKTITIPPDVCQKTKQLIHRYITEVPGGKTMLQQAYENIYDDQTRRENEKPFKGSVLNNAYFSPQWQQKTLRDFESLLEFNESVNQGVAEAEENPQDAVSMDVPLLIRIMEYAREDAKTDMDLHDVAENLIRLSAEGRTLSMHDYATIMTGKGAEQADESLTPDNMHLDKASRVKAGDKIIYKGKFVGVATGEVADGKIFFKLVKELSGKSMNGIASLPIDLVSLREVADTAYVDSPGAAVQTDTHSPSPIGSIEEDDEEEEFGYRKLHPHIFKARQKYPLAKTDMEALLMYTQDQEHQDVTRIDKVNDREDAEINKLDKEEDYLQRKLSDLMNQMNHLKSSINAKQIKEEVPPAVATAGGPAGATQPKQTPPGQPVDAAQLALQKQQQSKMQQNLANLKTAGVQLDPAKTAQTLQKTDTGAPMNAMDKDNISKIAPAIGNVMANPSTATQLNTLIKKAGGGA